MPASTAPSRTDPRCSRPPARRRSSRRHRRLDTPARSVSISSATASARISGEADAVSSKNRSTSGTGAGGASPGHRGSAATTSAISSALRAAASAPSGVASFEAATPMWPALTTRTRSPVSSRAMLWWISELANRVSPPDSCINSTSTSSAPRTDNAPSAILRNSSGPSTSGAPLTRAPPPARCGSAPERRRGRHAPPARADPCRSSACPTRPSPRRRRPRRTSPRTPA